MAKNASRTSNFWLPVLLAIFAFANAALYALYQVQPVQRYSPFLFGFCLGLALILWGRKEQQTGKIKGKRVHVYKSDNPVLFNILLVAKRILPGAIMMLVGIWYGLFGKGS